MSLLKLINVKRAMNIEHDLEDTRIADCILAGEAIVLDYLKITERAFLVGSPEQVVLPKHIEIAMLLVIESVYDGPRHPITNALEDPISPAVVSILARSRDPAMA